MDTVISVENLGKRYQLLTARDHYKTIRESLSAAVTRRFWRQPTNGATGHFWALRNVSFQANEGEVIGIIGRNGAGKSTLLKLLSRITEPTEGGARVRGRVGSLLEVGTGFHPELSGRENVYLSGAILGMKKTEIDRLFDEIVAFSEVEKFLETPLKRYSSGMYLRLAFAVAAHLQPDILFVDEVLAVGDAAFQKKCIGKMSEVSKGGRTILFVSHNMGAVSSLCSRVILLANGSIAADGEPRDVIHLSLKQQEEGEGADIERMRVRGYGESARITQMQMLNENGTVLFQDALRFRIRVASDRRHERLRVAGTIRNVVGVPVGTYFTHDSFAIDAGASVELEVTVDNFNLAPDHYHAGFSIGIGGPAEQWTNLDIVDGGISFEVSMAGKGDLHITWWNSSVVGNVLIPSASVAVLNTVNA
jgi:lipopolysaccharide transport system ATP-binding protein